MAGLSLIDARLPQRKEVASILAQIPVQLVPLMYSWPPGCGIVGAGNKEEVMRPRPSYEMEELNPWRKPSWRWDRACEIVAERRYATRRCDEPTRRAVRFLRKLNACRSDRGVRNLTKSEPDLMMALKFHQAAGLRRLELHCRILARESTCAIARNMGLTARIVATYKLLFFSVEDRIEASGYITHQVCGLPVGGPPSTATLMMVGAYRHGPHVIDAWIDFLHHAEESHDLSTSVGRRRESIALLIEAHQLREDESTRWSLEKKAPFIFENQRKPARTRSVGQYIAENTERMLTEFSWATDAEEEDWSAVEMTGTELRLCSASSRQVA